MLEAKVIIFGIIVLAIGSTIAGYTLYERHQAVAAYQVKVNEQEAKLKEKDDKLIAVANEEIVHMDAAFKAGEEKANALRPQIKVRSDKYVAANKAFANPVCDVGADFLYLINSATSGMRTATIASERPNSVPAAGPITGQPNGNGSTGAAGGSKPSGSVGPVHPQPRPIDSTSTIPGHDLSTHPKPKPIGH